MMALKNFFPLFALLVSLTVAPVWAAPAFIEALDFNKPLYGGFQFASSKVALTVGERTENDITRRLSADNSDVGLGFLLGMAYNESVNLDLRYQRLGDFTHRIVYIDASRQIQANVTSDLAYESLSIVVRPEWHVSSRFSLDAQAGLAYVSLDRGSDITVIGQKSQSELDQLEQELRERIGNDKDSEFVFAYGLGLSYQHNERWQWRFVWQSLAHDGMDISVQGLEFVRSF